MKTAAFVAGTVLALSPAHAETTDFAKMTCDYLTQSYLEEVVVIGAWMSGYYNAKWNNTTIDSKQVEMNTAKVMQYCRGNPQETVMHAIELVSGASK